MKSYEGVNVFLMSAVDKGECRFTPKERVLSTHWILPISAFIVHVNGAGEKEEDDGVSCKPKGVTTGNTYGLSV